MQHGDREVTAATISGVWQGWGMSFSILSRTDYTSPFAALHCRWPAVPTTAKKRRGRRFRLG
jgi:hypothetical protein